MAEGLIGTIQAEGTKFVPPLARRDGTILTESLRRGTEGRPGDYLSAPALDLGLESTIIAPKAGDAAGITAAIALAQDNLEQPHG